MNGYNDCNAYDTVLKVETLNGDKSTWYCNDGINIYKSSSKITIENFESYVLELYKNDEVRVNRIYIFQE